MRLSALCSAAVGLSTILFSLPAAADPVGCLDGYRLENALAASHGSVSARMASENISFDEAFAETQALAILYWEDAGYQAVQEGKVTTSLDMCPTRNGCGVPETSDGSAFQALDQYISHDRLYANDMRDEPPALTPALLAPDASMVRWAEATLSCDTSLPPPPPPPPPPPTGVCVRGEALDRKIDQYLAEVFENPGSDDSAIALMRLQAYSIHAWQERGRAGATDERVSWALTQCAEDECGEPARFDTSPYGGLLVYLNEVQRYNFGQRSTPPYPPTIRPEGKMLVWANSVIGCDWEETGTLQEMYGASSRNQRLLVTQGDVEEDRSFYVDAMVYGGAYFLHWWEENKGLWSLEDHEWLCQNFGEESRQCTWTRMWALDERHRVWNAQRGYDPNGPYTDPGAGNFQLDGPLRTWRPDYTPRSNERRCYNQGDGTERCFYD